MSEESGLDGYAEVCELFAALASPVRAATVHLLSQQEMSVGALADALGVSQPLVSQHLRVLRAARLVSSRREGREVLCSLADTHVAHIFIDALTHSQEGPTP